MRKANAAAPVGPAVKRRAPATVRRRDALRRSGERESGETVRRAESFANERKATRRDGAKDDGEAAGARAGISRTDAATPAETARRRTSDRAEAIKPPSANVMSERPIPVRRQKAARGSCGRPVSRRQLDGRPYLGASCGASFAWMTLRLSHGGVRPSSGRLWTPVL
jgi:hypothetical protein